MRVRTKIVYADAVQFWSPAVPQTAGRGVPTVVRPMEDDTAYPGFFYGKSDCIPRNVLHCYYIDCRGQRKYMTDGDWVVTRTDGSVKIVSDSRFHAEYDECEEP